MHDYSRSDRGGAAHSGAHMNPRPPLGILIRPEYGGEESAIGELTRLAFASHPRSTHNEHSIVQALRSANALTVSLVAEQTKRIVGHIAFSPVRISDRSPGWYGLGPVAVTPPLQGQGIGRALIEHGLQQLRGLGAQGCVVFGNPGLYNRFGFARHPGLYLAGVPQEFFLALPFGAKSAEGELTYHAAFSAAG